MLGLCVYALKGACVSTCTGTGYLSLLTENGRVEGGADWFSLQRIEEVADWTVTRLRVCQETEGVLQTKKMALSI